MSTENKSVEQEFALCLPDMSGSANDFTPDEMADDMDGLLLGFQRIKIPAGGSLQFELPGDDPENPDYARAIEGVILYNHAQNAYWPEGNDDDEDTTPLCSSVDGKYGCGEPGGDCATCGLNKFGTGSNGKGKACKNMRILYILRSGEDIPVQLALSPTSIKPFSNFYSTTFAARRRGTCGTLVSIGLKRMENGNTYSVATFKKIKDFTGEELAALKEYASGFKAQIKALNQQRVTEIAESTSGEYPYSEYESGMGEGNSESFTISTPGTEINGDTDNLPQ